MALNAFLTNPHLSGLTPELTLQTYLKELLDNSVDSASDHKALRRGLRVSVSLSPATHDTAASLTFSDTGFGILDIPDSLGLFTSSKSGSASLATGRFGIGLTVIMLHAWSFAMEQLEQQAGNEPPYPLSHPVTIQSRDHRYDVTFNPTSDSVIFVPIPLLQNSEYNTIITLPLTPSIVSSGMAEALTFLKNQKYNPAFGELRFSSVGESFKVQHGGGVGDGGGLRILCDHRVEYGSEEEPGNTGGRRRFKVKVEMFTGVRDGDVDVDDEENNNNNNNNSEDVEHVPEVESDNRCSSIKIHRILNSSLLLSTPECQSCEILEFARKPWTEFEVRTGEVNGSTFKIWDAETAGGGVHDQFEFDDGGEKQGNIPIGERLGNVLVVISVEGPKKTFDFSSLTKSRVTSVDNAVGLCVAACVRGCLLGLREADPKLIVSSAERRVNERKGNHVDLVVGAIVSIVGRSADGNWRSNCYRKFGEEDVSEEEREEGRKEGGGGEDMGGEEMDEDSKSEASNISWEEQDDEGKFGDRMKEIIRSGF
ncbi:hypothetical protein TrLO_g13872 [Triparma laevis f. longispina]|uniref:Uncharacterized protein n=1 Tax=Triparma laevis f. longispina TaxID=1714387 RepID=A0A9W7FRG2_9STRA|nr:hypothetical protein TrLO_g13872 [Triparma laevis f. longispina]